MTAVAETKGKEIPLTNEIKELGIESVRISDKIDYHGEPILLIKITDLDPGA